MRAAAWLAAAGEQQLLRRNRGSGTGSTTWPTTVDLSLRSFSTSADAQPPPPPPPSPPLPQRWDAPYAEMPPSRIRNFCIVAHIDHGKSTLADRLLEATGSLVFDNDKSKRAPSLPAESGALSSSSSSSSWAGTAATAAAETGSATATAKAATGRAQYLDGMDLERERGITIKLNSARMRYKTAAASPAPATPPSENGKQAGSETEYALNLIDTPGHVDFSYEVSRSLAACEGALLIVDASQGVEAQTLANVHLALDAGLEVLPVINKVDLPSADPERVRREIEEVIGIDASEAILTSAKRGTGISQVLEAIVSRFPPPKDTREAPLRALIFDSFYDDYKGVVVSFRVVDGSLKAGDVIKLMSSKKEYVVDEVGVLTPRKVAVERLSAGDVGFLSASIKAVADARVGDTITLKKRPAEEALPGYKEATPMVYCGLFPSDSEASSSSSSSSSSSPAGFAALREALGRLQLNDAALRFEPEVSPAMGFGFRCGFLGLLHMEIVQERLEREYGLNLIRTAPSVAYRVKLRKTGGSKEEKELAAAAAKNGSGDGDGGDSDPLLISVDNPASIPDVRDHIQEPYIRAEIICPASSVGSLMEAATARRGELVDMRFLGEGGGGGGGNKDTDLEGEPDSSSLISSSANLNARASLSYDLPLAEVVADFFDEVKSRSKGYASVEYQVTGWRKSDLVRLDVKINGETAEALSTVVHRDGAYSVGRSLCRKLKELIPRQQFKVPIQAAINGSRVIASESIPALRKDVLAKCYGGDVSRKKKLLKKQAEGKKRMKSIGKVEVPQAAFMAVLSQRNSGGGVN